MTRLWLLDEIITNVVISYGLKGKQEPNVKVNIKGDP